MKKLIISFFLIFISFSLIGGTYYNESFFYSIDYPTDFSLVDDSQVYDAFFQNNRGEAFIEVTVFDLAAAPTNEKLFSDIIARFNAKGSYNKTVFCKYNASRGTIRFNLEGADLTMDLVIFKDNYFFYATMGYSYTNVWKKYQQPLYDIVQTLKIYYDDNVVYGNDTGDSSVVEVPENKDFNEKNEDYNNVSGEYDELRPVWDYYKPVFQYLKSDLLKAQQETRDIAFSGDCWARYGVDPYGPEANKEFWHGFYLDMYKKNYYRVTSTVDWFTEEAKKKGWNTFALAENVIKALQSIEYGHPEELGDTSSDGSVELGFFTPNEVAHYNRGDCDTKSLFLVIILRRLGFDACMYYSEVYCHAMLGLNINASGYYKTYNGKKYYIVESTYPGWKIGQISEEWADMNNWYLLPIY